MRCLGLVCTLLQAVAAAPSIRTAPSKRLFSGYAGRFSVPDIPPEYVDPPRLDMASLVVEEGGEASLLCEASGVPPPLIHWTKDGEILQGSAFSAKERELERLLNLGLRTVSFGVTKSRLRLPCKASGAYVCHASNGHYEDSLSTGVSSASASCVAAAASPPVISQWSESRLEAEGGTATLLCRAQGADELRWEDSQGTLLDGKGKFQPLPNGDLLVVGVGWSEMDTYVCRATNAHGEDSREAFLYPTALDDALEEER